jgi:hypothetical protein
VIDALSVVRIALFVTVVALFQGAFKLLSPRNERAFSGTTDLVLPYLHKA